MIVSSTEVIGNGVGDAHPAPSRENPGEFPLMQASELGLNHRVVGSGDQRCDGRWRRKSGAVEIGEECGYGCVAVGDFARLHDRQGHIVGQCRSAIA